MDGQAGRHYDHDFLTIWSYSSSHLGQVKVLRQSCLFLTNSFPIRAFMGLPTFFTWMEFAGRLWNNIHLNYKLYKYLIKCCLIFTVKHLTFFTTHITNCTVIASLCQYIISERIHYSKFCEGVLVTATKLNSLGLPWNKSSQIWLI